VFFCASDWRRPKTILSPGAQAGTAFAVMESVMGRAESLAAGTALSESRRQGQERMSFEDNDYDKLLTRGEVAQLCRVHVRTVERWLMAGKLTSHVVTPSGRILFRRRDVLTFVARAQTTPSNDER
jgi:excisionase family DNA binding protein